MFFYILLVLALAFALVYFIVANHIMETKKVEADVARKIVNSYIKKFLKDFWHYLVTEPEPEQNWLADDTLVQNLLTAQAPYNHLSVKFTLYAVGYEQTIPCVKIQFFPLANAPLHILEKQLENAVIQRLAFCTGAKVWVRVDFIPVSHVEMIIRVLYAVTPPQMQALQKQSLAARSSHSQKARQAAAPLIDPALNADLENGQVTKTAGTSRMLVGYDIQTRTDISIDLLSTGMVAIVGGTGSGKSVAVLYLLYNLKKTYDAELFVGDFKRSGDFTGISQNYAEAEDVTALIDDFYAIFTKTSEGNNMVKVLLIDEYAGYITWLTQQDKKKAEEIKGKISSILMLGRSRRCFVWCIQQRMSASLFPSGIGAIDNFQVCIGLGRLSPDSRKSLFAGEHLQDTDFEANYKPGTGQGLILVDGQPLQALQVPKISDKKNLQQLLRNS